MQIFFYIIAWAIGWLIGYFLPWGIYLLIKKIKKYKQQKQLKELQNFIAMRNNLDFKLRRHIDPWKHYE